MNHSNPKLAILSVLFSNESKPVKGLTRLQKIVFIAQHETELDVNYYDFEPKEYGPFSPQVYTDLDDLISNGLVNLETEGTPGSSDRNQYEITSKGKQMLTHLSIENSTFPLSTIGNLKSEFNNMPLLQIVKRVNDNYPEMAVNSTVLQ